MCGLAGVIFGKKRRRAEEREYLAWLFTRLLVISESRGPHATGIAWLNRDGEHRLFKRPVPAGQFVTDKAYHKALSGIDNRTTLLLGHTRWRTRGDERVNCNNQPIRAGIILGTHNGTIYNANYLFRRLGLPRFAEVDSELIFRLADRFTPDGSIEVNDLKRALTLCRGQMSAVLVSQFDPEVITVLKGNKPLFLWTHKLYRVVIYASDRDFINQALNGEKGWHELDVPPMTMLTIQHTNIRAVRAQQFNFIAQERKGTIPKGVDA